MPLIQEETERTVLSEETQILQCRATDVADDLSICGSQCTVLHSGVLGWWHEGLEVSSRNKLLRKAS